MCVSLSGLVTTQIAETTPSVTSTAIAPSCSFAVSLRRKPAAAFTVTGSTTTELDIRDATLVRKRVTLLGPITGRRAA